MGRALLAVFTLFNAATIQSMGGFKFRPGRNDPQSLQIMHVGNQSDRKAEAEADQKKKELQEVCEKLAGMIENVSRANVNVTHSKSEMGKMSKSAEAVIKGIKKPQNELEEDFLYKAKFLKGLLVRIEKRKEKGWLQAQNGYDTEPDDYSDSSPDPIRKKPYLAELAARANRGKDVDIFTLNRDDRDGDDCLKSNEHRRERVIFLEHLQDERNEVANLRMLQENDFALLQQQKIFLPMVPMMERTVIAFNSCPDVIIQALTYIFNHLTPEEEAELFNSKKFKPYKNIPKDLVRIIYEYCLFDVWVKEGTAEPVKLVQDSGQAPKKYARQPRQKTKPLPHESPAHKPLAHLSPVSHLSLRPGIQDPIQSHEAMQGEFKRKAENRQQLFDDVYQSMIGDGQGDAKRKAALLQSGDPILDQLYEKTITQGDSVLAGFGFSTPRSSPQANVGSSPNALDVQKIHDDLHKLPGQPMPPSQPLLISIVATNNNKRLPIAPPTTRSDTPGNSGPSSGAGSAVSSGGATPMFEPTINNANIPSLRTMLLNQQSDSQTSSQVSLSQVSVQSKTSATSGKPTTVPVAWANPSHKVIPASAIPAGAPGSSSISSTTPPEGRKSRCGCM